MPHALYALSASKNGDDELGWVAGKPTINFLTEVMAGARLLLRPKILRIGKTSLTLSIGMRDANSDQLRAEAEFVSVLFDLKIRKSVELGGEISQRASIFPFHSV
ncbi:MAG: hypothetical protein IPK23_00010 [Rhizobiales bacterium]|nr:hypothetical protein [Hyphomicrobiales bacterium]